MKIEKIIKQITLPRYTIKLVEINDAYIIEYTNNQTSGVNFSESIEDYKNASFLFDLKAEELEGN